MADNDDNTEPEDKPDNEPDNDDTEPDGDDDKGDKGDKGKGKADKGDESDLADAGKRALTKLRRELAAIKRERDEHAGKLKEIADKDKTETQRLSEAADTATSRASKAETALKRFQVAMDSAPEGATLKQVQAVAKRLQGETDEELESDAEELFELMASRTETKKTPNGKPKPNLRGGADPEEEPEEMNPAKLAALIPRNR